MSVAYGHVEYARSLSDVGKPLHLAGCGGYLLLRDIAATEEVDATGPYPLFMCERWDRLSDDLATLDQNIVSVTLVADPLGSHDSDDLTGAFPDCVRPFKRHFIVELDADWLGCASPHHRRHARRALQALRIDVLEDPAPALSDWVSLYDHLVDRHAVTGVARFSRAAFEAQFRVPGVVMVRAMRGQAVVGAALWYRAGESAYYHLGAYSEDGYREGASHAIFHSAFAWLGQRGIRRVNLGGAAGLSDDPEDGLARFKRGWATTDSMAYLCGRIVNHSRYLELSGGATEAGFFPAYRDPARRIDHARA